MSDKPHNNIQQPSQMLATAQERRLNSKIYNKTADGGSVVSAIVEQLAEELTEIPQKADLRNTEQIKKVVIAYVAMCSQAGTIPSKIGLARALGMSRRTIDYFLERHPEHPTAEVLELAFDAFAEALSTAALANATNNVYSIFLSKALYRFEDTVTVKAIPPDPMDSKSNAAEILDRWKDRLDMFPDDN